VVEDRELGFASALDDGPPVEVFVRGWLGVGRLASEDNEALAAYDDWRLEWTGRQPWIRGLQPQVDAVHSATWRLVASLVEEGALTPDEARRYQPRLVVEVVDARRDPRPPLPPVPPSTVAHPWRPRPPAHGRGGV
jgi:hypothetical protein